MLRVVHPVVLCLPDWIVNVVYETCVRKTLTRAHGLPHNKSMAHTSDFVPEASTPACASVEGVLTHAQYHRYAVMFDGIDLITEVCAQSGGRDRVQFHGATAGRALRAWCAHRGITVESTDLQRVTYDDQIIKWTMLSVSNPCITVHLDEEPLITRGPAIESASAS